MKTILPLLLSIVFLLLTGYAVFTQQNRWSYVGADVNGTRFFIDRKSKEIKGNKLRIWNKSIYSDDSYRISLVEWICSEKKFYIIDETIYAPNGTFAGTDKGTKWLLITPDSISEGMYKATCPSSKKKPSQTSTNKMMAQIIVQKANIRAEPNANSLIIQRATIGERFNLADEESTGGWYQIILSDSNETAWIHGSTIKLVEAVNKTTNKKQKVKQQKNRKNSN